jgi:signal transduction histidine kinase
MASWLRDRSVRVAAGITIAVAIPGALLFYFQFRSLSDLGRASTVVLQQLSRETSESLVKATADALKSPYIDVLLRVGQRQTEPLDLPFIESTFEPALAADPFVSRYYVWSELTDVHRGRVLAYDRGGGGFTPDPPESGLLLERLHELARERQPIATFEATIDGRRTYFQAQLRFTAPARDRLTSFVAFRVDAERLRSDFFPSFVAREVGAMEGPSGFPPLDVTVLDDEGRVIFPAGRGSAPAHVVDERTFPLLFFDEQLMSLAASGNHLPETWRILTGYGDQTIAGIIEAREQPQRAMMAVLAVVMALGVIFVAGAAAREVHVAELKSSFVSSVSHDLKTPLALIQLFAETLELGRVKHTERAQEYYRIINSEARKLTRLIDNLLDFSRIEAGLRSYRREPADLDALVRRTLEALDSQFRHNRFQVAYTASASPVPVLIDPDAARQAIENLLSNAMKYSPDHGDIQVAVDADGGFGRVRVTDRGIGIAPRQQRRIFRKFYRVQTDAGSGPQGTGLGLAIVDHVMRGHGGFVRVDSEPGRGSTFTLHFPLLAGEAHGDEADSGGRGRAADVARSA